MTHAINIAPGISIPGKYANRHGLITGATGTGKTVTLQRLCEEFSAAGVPVFVADVKGDISGLCTNPANTVEFWAVGGTAVGSPVNLSVGQLGEDLLSYMLGLTDAQKGLIELCFAHKPDMQGLTDLSSAMDAVARSPASGAPGAATFMAVARAVTRFNRDCGDLIGAPGFDLSDLLQTTPEGRGVINIFSVENLIHTGKAYAVFMVWLLRELMERMPEAGDLDAPRFVLFIDEAHLLFDDAPEYLRKGIETMIRLVRSKGVGVYFVSQSPSDLPSTVLGQLGNRVQHALRGATVQDIRAIKAAADTMPINPRIDAAEAIKSLSVGEALVSVLSEAGVPVPVERVQVSLPGCELRAATREERAAHVTRAKRIPSQVQATAGESFLSDLGTAGLLVSVLGVLIYLGYKIVVFAFT